MSKKLGFVVGQIGSAKKKDGEDFIPVLCVTGEFQSPESVDVTSIWQATAKGLKVTFEDFATPGELSKFGNGKENAIKATILFDEPEHAEVARAFSYFQAQRRCDVYIQPPLPGIDVDMSTGEVKFDDK